MSEHTEGRLRAEAEPWDHWEVNLSSVTGDCHIAAVGQDDVPTPERDANARRLVACWNACRGISTEQLEEVAGCETDESRFDRLGWIVDGPRPGEGP